MACRLRIGKVLRTCALELDVFEQCQEHIWNPVDVPGKKRCARLQAMATEDQGRCEHVQPLIIVAVRDLDWWQVDLETSGQ
jgi:hypothetical protein